MHNESIMWFLNFMLNKESSGEIDNKRLLLHLLGSDSTCLEEGL